MEEEQPYLGDLLTMVLNHLQVLGWSSKWNVKFSHEGVCWRFWWHFQIYQQRQISLTCIIWPCTFTWTIATVDLHFRNLFVLPWNTRKSFYCRGIFLNWPFNRWTIPLLGGFACSVSTALRSCISMNGWLPPKRLVFFLFQGDDFVCFNEGLGRM